MNCKNHPNRPTINNHFKLCRECNNERLYGNKYGKVYKNTLKSKKPLKSSYSKPNGKTLEKIRLDEEFYEKCFSLSDHKCEECGTDLPNRFRDDDGKVIARYRYSHIKPKSTHPKLRHNVKNINHLCLKHHTQWDFGNKEEMKIYESNKQRFPNLF